MDKFARLSGVAAPLPMVNIDTDQIIPKQFLKTIKRTGLGRHLFAPMRYRADGSENPDFVLNREPYRHARIIVAGDNFGCGSSREHAPWALRDFGIRCVIAPSFADIFRNNCFKNGILAITLERAAVERLLAAAGGGAATLAVDLERQVVSAADGDELRFEVDPFRKDCLLNGLDEIALTLQREDEIAAFEAAQRAAQPWLYAAPGQPAAPRR